MVGLFGKVFGGKKKEEQEVEEPQRNFRPEPSPEPQEEAGQRWLEAKRWREDKAMQEPLVKRGDFKRRI